jgi:ribose-phosphate pyrophosphokinase
MFRSPNDFRIIAGSAHPGLVDRICGYLEVERTDTTVSSFPDGETFVQINENVRGCDVFIVQPTCPPTNQNLMELLIMVDAARRASAERITAVLPFFGYARQDRKDKPRVPITAKLVANLLVASGVTRVLTMDLHAGQIQGFFDIPVDHLYAAPFLIKYLRDEGMFDDPEKFVMVSPDVGGIKMVYAYAQAIGCGFAIVAKHRVSATEVEAQYLVGEVSRKHVLIVDDMTETAGTLVAASDLLKEHGAKSIRAGVSHAVLNDVALARLKESVIEELICTDSVPMAGGGKVTTVGVAELLGEGIRRIHEGKSVSSLFRAQ